jgi:hypothetical protein
VKELFRHFNPLSFARQSRSTVFTGSARRLGVGTRVVQTFFNQDIGKKLYPVLKWCRRGQSLNPTLVNRLGRDHVELLRVPSWHRAPGGLSLPFAPLIPASSKTLTTCQPDRSADQGWIAGSDWVTGLGQGWVMAWVTGVGHPLGHALGRGGSGVSSSVFLSGV